MILNICRGLTINNNRIWDYSNNICRELGIDTCFMINSFLINRLEINLLGILMILQEDT